MKRNTGKSGKNRGLILLEIAVAAVFIFAAYKVVTILIDYGSARGEYQSLSDNYGPSATQSGARPGASEALTLPNSEPETSPPASLFPDTQIDFESLRQINPDIVAWVVIPGADISYPVVQAANNDKYLSTSFAGKNSGAGAIFLDCDCSSSFDSDRSIIYGHNMRDGTMFAGLNKFKDLDFAREHREIYLYTENDRRLLSIISVYPMAAEASQRQIEFSPEEMSAFVDEILAASVVEIESDLAGVNRIYSFCTCSYEWYDTRTWVHAVEIQVEPYQ